MLNLDQIEDALRRDIITLKIDPLIENGTVCSIGDYWFYLNRISDSLDDLFDNNNPDEIKKLVPIPFLALLIWIVLKDFNTSNDDGFVDEYNYFEAYILEKLKNK